MDEKSTEALRTTTRSARDTFESWCAVGPGEVPADPTDALQVKLWRWQVRNFGTTIDERLALGVVEVLGETFHADDAEAALDGLGDVMVYAGQLAIANRLALRPIIELAKLVKRDGSGMAIVAAGKFCHTVLKAAQKIREGRGDVETYRGHLVAGLAACIAKAIEDVYLRGGATRKVVLRDVPLMTIRKLREDGLLDILMDGRNRTTASLTARGLQRVPEAAAQVRSQPTVATL